MEKTWLNSLLFNLLEERGHSNHNKGNVVLQIFPSIGLNVLLGLEGPITPPQPICVIWLFIMHT
jgi:hypothetical protein